MCKPKEEQKVGCLPVRRIPGFNTRASDNIWFRKYLK
jgi:hypothetical protein